VCFGRDQSIMAAGAFHVSRSYGVAITGGFVPRPRAYDLPPLWKSKYVTFFTVCTSNSRVCQVRTAAKSEVEAPPLKRTKMKADA
jgi:hypothetical protein